MDVIALAKSKPMVLYGSIGGRQNEEELTIITTLCRDLPNSDEPKELWKEHLLTANELEKILSRGTPFCIKTEISDFIAGVALSIVLYPDQAGIIDGVGMVECGDYTFFTAESPTYG